MLEQLNKLMSSFDRDYALKFILLFCVQLALAQFAGALFRGGTSPAVIYLPSAVGLVAILLWGYGYWPAIALATFISPIISGSLPVTAAGVSLAHTLQAVVGAYLLRRYDFQPLFGRLRDTFTFGMVVAATGAIVPTIGYAVTSFSNLLLGTPLPSISWFNWWVGEFFSMLLFAPFFMRWLAFPELTHRARQEWAEIGITFVLLTLISWILFWTPYSTVVGVSMIYLLLLPFFWIALRVGPRFMTLALVLLTLIALTGTAFGVHPPSAAEQTLGQRLFSIQLFIIFLSIVFLTLTTAAEERKDATKSLSKHVDDLEDALLRIQREDQAKNEFLAILAHELRNPLSPILSSLELVEQNKAKGMFAAENEPHFKSIKTHIQMITRLLDDLLDISRITRKKFKLNKTIVELQSLIEQSALTVHLFYQERGHTFTAQTPKESIWIEADPLRLQQIIVNILYNAGKYTNPGGRIDLVAQLVGEKLEIRVKDNGIGIAPEMLKKIFEPFVQIPTDVRMGTGLGLGLSLTKRLAELHGGYIQAKSKGLGHGSEFTVILPLPRTAQLPMPLTVTAPEVVNASGKPRSILVVDDNQPAAESLGALLKGKGYEVSTVYNGAQAIEAQKRAHPDVVILDIGLPDMDGYSVARKLKEEKTGNSNPILIALTGYGQSDDKRKAREAGFAYHLTKPVGIAEVQAVLSKIHV